MGGGGVLEAEAMPMTASGRCARRDIDNLTAYRRGGAAVLSRFLVLDAIASSIWLPHHSPGDSHVPPICSVKWF